MHGTLYVHAVGYDVYALKDWNRRRLFVLFMSGNLRFGCFSWHWTWDCLPVRSKHARLYKLLLNQGCRWLILNVNHCTFMHAVLVGEHKVMMDWVLWAHFVPARQLPICSLIRSVHNHEFHSYVCSAFWNSFPWMHQLRKIQVLSFPIFAPSYSMFLRLK